MKSKNKIIISDLDGTLLRSDKTISSYSTQVLDNCRKMGCKLIFATARPPRDVYKYIPNELKKETVISYNGAMILKNEQIIYKKTIDKKDVLEIVQTAEQEGFSRICLEIDDELYANFDASHVYGWSPCKISDFHNLCFEEALKVIICSELPIEAEFLESLPPNCSGVITDGGLLCQIMHTDVSKWNAIKRAINKIEDSEIIAFGDDYNDFDMIENATIGIAMDNAISELKSIADSVTKSNDEDGVALFLEKNML